MGAGMRPGRTIVFRATPTWDCKPVLRPQSPVPPQKGERERPRPGSARGLDPSGRQEGRERERECHCCVFSPGFPKYIWGGAKRRGRGSHPLPLEREREGERLTWPTGTTCCYRTISIFNLRWISVRVARNGVRSLTRVITQPPAAAPIALSSTWRPYHMRLARRWHWLLPTASWHDELYKA